MKLILFLGAGVSVPSGLETVDRLTRKILRSTYHQNVDRTFSPGPQTDQALRQSDVTLRVRTFLRCLSRYDERGSKHAVYRRGAPTYEDLFSLCQELWLWHIGLTDNSISTSFVESIERVARPLLKGRSLKTRIRDLGSLAGNACVFMESAVAAALQSQRVAGFELLLELTTTQTIEQLNIVTLNHDTLVEQYLTQNGVAFVDGFGPRDGDVRWYDDGVYDSGQARVRVFKLHGSVNWREFVGRLRLAIVLGPDMAQIADGEQRQLNLDRRTPSFLSGVNKAIAYQRGIYADAHFRFHEVLRQCTVMVMSGYGWGDTAINWRLDTWLDQNKRNTIILLHPHPDEIAQRSVIVGRAYDYWTQGGQLRLVPKWLCETSMRDIEGEVHSATASRT